MPSLESLEIAISRAFAFQAKEAYKLMLSKALAFQPRKFMKKPMDKRAYLFEKIPVDVLGLESIPQEIVKLANGKLIKPKAVFYLNSACASLALSNKEYLEILQKGDLVYADGWGVVLAAKLMGKKLPERANAADFFDHFCQLVAKKKLSLYLLGGKKEIVLKAATNLKQKFPKLKITGYHHGFFDKKQEEEIIEEINNLKPDFLLIGLGVPKQEKWMVKHRNKLQVKVIWGVGGLFNLLSGGLSRAPKLMRNFGLEWLYRLFQEPERLGKRYLFGLPPFFFRVIKWRFGPILRKLNLISLKIINFILTSFVYWLGFGVVSVVGKLFKKKFLETNNQDGKTYWKEIREKLPLKSFYRQF